MNFVNTYHQPRSNSSSWWQRASDWSPRADKKCAFHMSSDTSWVLYVPRWVATLSMFTETPQKAIERNRIEYNYSFFMAMRWKKAHQDSNVLICDCFLACLAAAPTQRQFERDRAAPDSSDWPSKKNWVAAGSSCSFVGSILWIRETKRLILLYDKKSKCRWLAYQIITDYTNCLNAAGIEKLAGVKAQMGDIVTTLG